VKLLTKSIAKKLPKLNGSAPDPIDQRKVPLKYFQPDGTFRWYVLAYDSKVQEFYGLVTSHVCPQGELEYFSLRFLKTIRGEMGMPVEIDLNWDSSKTIGDILNTYATQE
jgi:hypothetical protein